MPLFGNPRKPFKPTQSNGEQVDAVRSKIASLMDGVTEADTQLPEPVADHEVADHKGVDGATVQQWDSNTVDSRHEAHGEDYLSGGFGTTMTNGVEHDDMRYTNSVNRPPTHQSHDVELTSDEVDNWPRRSPVVSESSVDRALRQDEAATTPFAVDDPSWTARRSYDLPNPSPVRDAESNAVEPSQPSPHPEQTKHPLTNAIHIKGQSGGILIEVGHGHWPDLMVALEERLASAASFFRNGTAALDLAARPLTEPELHHLHQLLNDHALELVLVRTASTDTFQVALDMGLAAQFETADGQTEALAQPALSNLAEEQHFVYSGHLRAGQILQRQEHILVIGDVNPGATVISNGDILVWGHLRGMAHAGAGGDNNAIICALNLTPVQLRISDFIAIAPEQKTQRGWRRQRVPVKQPEIAYLADDRIIVEPWDATKFGGIAAFRRQK